MRSRAFKGTAKEIAEQFHKDLCEARNHLYKLEPFTEAVMWISRSLYRIVAAFHGANICCRSNGVSTIQGIKVDKILNDFEDGTLMVEVFAMKAGKHYPTDNGGYMYKESEDTEER